MVGGACYEGAVVVQQALDKALSEGYLLVVEDDDSYVLNGNRPDVLHVVLPVRNLDDQLPELEREVCWIAEI